MFLGHWIDSGIHHSDLVAGLTKEQAEDAGNHNLGLIIWGLWPTFGVDAEEPSD